MNSVVDDKSTRSSRVDGPVATRKSQETRASILVAAARLFAEKGFSDCSLREIAGIAGMKAGSVYYYFASKDELLDAVLATGIARLTRNVLDSQQGFDDEASSADRLRQAIRAHVGSFLDVRNDANTFLRIYENLPPVMKRRNRAERQAYYRIWLKLVEDGQKRGEFDAALDPSIYIAFLLQGMNRIPEWFSPSRMTMEGVCDLIFATMVGSILKPSKG